MSDDYLAFVSTGSGFDITFANGYTVSIQWGVNAGGGKTTAEMAAWDTTGEWYAPWKKGVHDDIYPRATPEEVAAFIAEVSKL